MKMIVKCKEIKEIELESYKAQITLDEIIDITIDDNEDLNKLLSFMDHKALLKAVVEHFDKEEILESIGKDAAIEYFGIEEVS